MIELGKLYRVESILPIPVFERIPFDLRCDQEYFVLMYDNRLIEWYDSKDKRWGYRYSLRSLLNNNVILVTEILTNVTPAWAAINKPEYIAIGFLHEEISGWLHMSSDTPCLVPLLYETAENVEISRDLMG